MKSTIISLTFLFASLSLAAQVPHDKYIEIFRENENGELYQDSILECNLHIEKVKVGMTFTQVSDMTGKPTDIVQLTADGERSIVIWNYMHEKEINHSIEFANGKVENVILDYELHQKTLKSLIKD